MSQRELVNRRTIDKLVTDTDQDDSTQLLELYASELQLLLNNLREHIEARNSSQLLQDIHTAKSSAAIFGAELLYDAAISLEALARQAGTSIWGPATDMLEQVSDTLLVISRILDEYPIRKPT